MPKLRRRTRYKLYWTLVVFALVFMVMVSGAGAGWGGFNAWWCKWGWC